MKKVRAILCTLCAFIFIFECSAQAPVAQKGIIDLRNQDLSTHQIGLRGEWIFFWNQLIKPGEETTANHAFASYPSLWKEEKLNGKPLPSQGFATYKVTILLPKQRPLLALEIPDTYCSYSLFINGHLVVQNGLPGKTAEESKPFWVTRVAHLPDNSDTVTMLLQVSNFWHAKGGVYKDILIGQYDTLFIKHQRNVAYSFVLTGCLFMGGLFFLGLYLFGRKDKTILFFSLFCILYSYRMVGTDLYVLHYLFQDLNWFVTLRLEYLSIVLSVAFFALYTSQLYTEDCNMLIMKLLVGSCILYVLVILTTSTLFFTGLMPFFLGSMFIYMGYACYVYVQAALHRRIGSVYALLSSAVMIIIFLLANLNYFDVAPPFKILVFVAYIIFFFLQSLALSQRFAYSFKLAALQAQQGLNAKAEFLSTMSHEIRTPLNAVIGMTHLLKSNTPRDDQKENLDVLYFSANNLLSIVNNILDYTKIEEGKIVFENIPMDLSSIARNIIAGLQTNAKEKDIELKLVIDGRLDKKLMGDPTRTSQVINNLVHNAVKFTEKGSVQLSLHIESVNPSSITLLVKVEDTGIGIKQDKQIIIFDRFTQADSSTSRSYGGTGLGLAITKRILELQGVQLQLNSEQGKGSTFFFTQTFPLSIEDAIQKKTNVEVDSNADLLQGLSILLVEDNPLNVLVAQTILEGQGAHIDVATNGQEALDKFDTKKHKLILMDLHMPVLDGYKATEQLRKKGETLPIIALTASAPKEVESEAYASGLNDIVVKPFNPDDLYRIILHYVKAS
jgi:signal transduction histidine kinase/CheY-like chemotaxis protein